MPAEEPGPAPIQPLRLQTANDFLSLDEIDNSTGAVRVLSLIHETARGAIVVTGSSKPFIALVVELDSTPVPLGDIRWSRLGNWIPHFHAQVPEGSVECTYLTPPGKRGAAVRAVLRTGVPATAKLSFCVCWQDTRHVGAMTCQMNGQRMVGGHSTGDARHLSLRWAHPIFSIGLAASPGSQWQGATEECRAGSAIEDVYSTERLPVEFSVSRSADLQAGESLTLELDVGVGIEPASSVACAIDLRDQGWDSIKRVSEAFLDARHIHCKDIAEPFEELLNRNAFYNFFYSRATAIDTERRVTVSSRSPGSALTASYHDRDVCLYSFPAVLLIDPVEAREILHYVFGVQMRNIGARSRGLDGSLLQPGFSLDGLVAPIRALWMYVDLTDDLTVLFDQSVQSGLNRILETLEGASHPQIALYRTRLTPGERIAPLEYLTYSNMVVWRALVDLSDLYRRIRDVERSADTDQWARDVQAAILRHLVVRQDGGPVFCWASDLDGQTQMGDEPEGSLELATHLEFCRPTLPVFANTVARLRAQRSDDSTAGQSLLTMANRLLSGDLGPLESLREAPAGPLEPSGETGDTANTECALAGYLCYALVRALEAYVEPPVLHPKQAVRGRISRSILRPGVGWI